MNLVDFNLIFWYVYWIFFFMQLTLKPPTSFIFLLWEKKSQKYRKISQSIHETAINNKNVLNVIKYNVLSCKSILISYVDNADEICLGLYLRMRGWIRQVREEKSLARKKISFMNISYNQNTPETPSGYINVDFILYSGENLYIFFSANGIEEYIK